MASVLPNPRRHLSGRRPDRRGAWRFAAGLPFVLSLLLLGGAARATTVLLIPPKNLAGGGVAARQFASMIAVDLKLNPRVTPIVFDTSAPVIRQAMKKHLLSSGELRRTDDSDVAQHLALLLGADFVFFGDSRLGALPGVPGTLRFSLSQTTTSSVMLLPVAADEETLSADALRTLAQSVAAAILHRVTPAPVAPAAPPAQAHWAAAQELLKERRISDAIVEIQGAVAAAPDNAAYQVELGNLYLRLNRTAAAVDQFQEAATVSPFDPDVRIGLASALAASGDHAGALGAAKEAVRVAAGHPRAEARLGRLLLQLGETTLGRQELADSAASGDPDAADALADAPGNDDPAGLEAALRNAIQHDPGTPGPHERLAALQLRSGRTADAVQSLLAGPAAGAGLDGLGLLLASSAFDAELDAVLTDIGAVHPDGLPALRARLGALQTLLALFPAPAGKNELHSRRAVAIQDALQAVAERQQRSAGEDSSNVPVLVAQARRLLGFKESAPEGSGAP